VGLGVGLVPFSLLLSHSLFPSSLALSLTHRYSPIVDDVNKRIKIQITPVRSDGVEGPTYQVTHTHSLSLSLTHSLTHPLTHSLTRARALSLSPQHILDALKCPQRVQDDVGRCLRQMQTKVCVCVCVCGCGCACDGLILVCV
jgi:hypothetical protein